MPYLHYIPKWLQWLMPDAIYDMPHEGNKVVYLTFDDGPTEEVTDWVLDLLKSYEAKGTFFLLGKNVIALPTIFQRIIQEGHSIGNHSYHHYNASKTEHNTYIKDIDRASKIIPSPLFRPPYGRINRKIAKTLKEKKYKLVMWSILSGDFDVKIKPESCVDIVLKRIKPGAVIVFHDSVKAKNNLYKALPVILQYLKENGYSCNAIPMHS